MQFSAGQDLRLKNYFKDGSQSDRHLYFDPATQPVRRRKALDLGSLNMQFQQDGLKDKKITAL